MDIFIRKMEKSDEEAVIAMMRDFYSSPAVSTNGSEEIFRNDIDACTGENPYAEGYMIMHEEKIAGYGMLAKSFSTEFGRSCIWIEDIYLKEEFRGKGIGGRFFDYIEKLYPEAIFRLEASPDNDHAIALYKKQGYSVLDYTELKKIM